MTSAPPNARTIFMPELRMLAGAERVALALCEWLQSHGLPHSILTYNNACNFASFAAYPLPIVELPSTSGVRSRVAALRKYAAGLPADAPPLLCSGYQPALHATLAGIRGFHTLMHDTPALFGDAPQRTLVGKARTAISNRIIGQGLRSGGTTIVTSEFLQAECRKDFGIAAVIERMGGFGPRPTNNSFPAARPIDGTFRMLSVSRVESNKRLDWVIEALGQLERQPIAPLSAPLSHVVDWHFDIVGDGTLIAILRDLAAQQGLADRVHLRGFVSDSELETIYTEAKLFLMPAVQGYGIPAVEALARGLPVLLHRESGVSDILLDTPWATVMHGDRRNMPNALARAIDGVLRGSHQGVPAPQTPTAAQWSENVAHHCGWIPQSA